MVDMAELRKACAKVRLSILKNLSKKMSSPQFKNIIYKLALAIGNKSNESERYLYSPVFSFKSENIVTAFVDSKTLVNKCPIKLARFSHSKLWYFAKQYENLDTSPDNILQLIRTLEKTFFTDAFFSLKFFVYLCLDLLH